MILQHIYRPILNFIYEKITFRIPENMRFIVITLCFFAIFGMQFLSTYVSEYGLISRGLRDYAICLFFGTIIVLAIDKRLDIIKWRWSIYVPYTLAGILILIASLDHEMGPSYRAFPLIMLVAFMCFYYVMGNTKQYSKIVECMAKGYMLLFVIILLVCFFVFPFEVSHYQDMSYGPFGINPNGASKIFATGMIVALFLALKSNKSKFLYLAVSGGALYLIVLTKCRTGFLIAAVAFILYIAFEIYLASNKNEILKKLLKIAIFLLLIIIVSQFVMQNISISIYDSIELPEFKLVDKLREGKGNIIDPEEKAAIRAERFATLGNRITSDPVLSKLDDVLSSRISIWTIYIDNMSWTGESKNLFVTTEYAHNQYVELSYKAGIPVGIIYFVWVVLCGIYVFKNLVLKKDKSLHLCFFTLLYPAFFCITMLDQGVLPFERPYIFMFYIAVAYLFVNDKKQEKEKAADL